MRLVGIEQQGEEGDLFTLRLELDGVTLEEAQAIARLITESVDVRKRMETTLKETG